MASKARWLTSTRFQFLIAIAGIAFLLVGVLLLPKPHGVSEHPLVLDLALEIKGRQEFDKCPRFPPEVNPQIYFSQKGEHEFVAFLDIFGLFGGESERLTDSLAKYAGGRDPDSNSTLRVPRSTLQRMDRYNFNSLNCMYYQFIVKPDQDHNKTEQTKIAIQPVSVLTAGRADNQVSFRTNSLAQSDELFWNQREPWGSISVTKSLFDEYGTMVRPYSTEQPVVGVRFVIRCVECAVGSSGGLTLIVRGSYTQVPHSQVPLTREPGVQLRPTQDIRRQLVEQYIHESKKKDSETFARQHTKSGPISIRKLTNNNYKVSELILGEDYNPRVYVQENKDFVGIVWKDLNADYETNRYWSIGGLLMGIGLSMIIETLIYFLRLLLRVESNTP